MKEKKDNSFGWLALSFAWELGYSIVVPLVLLALLGRWLDKKFNSSPLFFLSFVVFSVFLTSFIVYRKYRTVVKEIEKREEKSKEQK